MLELQGVPPEPKAEPVRVAEGAPRREDRVVLLQHPFRDLVDIRLHAREGQVPVPAEVPVDLRVAVQPFLDELSVLLEKAPRALDEEVPPLQGPPRDDLARPGRRDRRVDRKSTRLNSSHSQISYAV